ncbi:MAG: RsmE family RNA methyltransferase [Spirochaetales bacterium]|nr:RsmE family RNA methyltransferase [Spirochaetales bacterium]
MRVFLLSQDYDGSPLYYLKKREVQYLEKVLRLEKGTVFTAKDTSDNYYEAKLEDEGTLLLKPTDNPEDTLLDSLSGYSGPFAPIDVYVSILKGKKNESVVRALTEIGVRKIIFMDTDNAQEHDFSSHQKERLEAILKEAVQQSGSRSPILFGPVPFFTAIEKSEGKKVILHQSLRGKTTYIEKVFADHDIKNVASLFIGPEGGFSDQECVLAENNGFYPVLLRTNILRAETAAVYTAAVVQSLLHSNS